MFSTHLFAGGDLLPLPGSDDPDRRHGVRMAQVEELLAFIDLRHHEANVTLAVGDFNISAERAASLTARMHEAGFVDVSVELTVTPTAAARPS